MKRFLCRVMVIVFSLNCLTPATGWGQGVRRSSVPSEEDIQAQIQAAQAGYSSAFLYEQVAEGVSWSHQAQFSWADYAADQQRLSEEIEKRQNYVAVPSSTRVRTPVVAVPVFSSVKEFLRHVETGDLDFEALINYADPLDTDIKKNNLLISTYAAEIIGNNMSQLAQIDDTEYDLSAMQETLAEMEARLAYRLAFLGKKVPSCIEGANKEPASQARTSLQQQLAQEPAMYQIMLVGTLRMTLLKIHQFFQAKNLPDPAEEYQKQKLAERMQKQQPPAPPQVIWESSPGVVTGGLPAAVIEERAAQGVKQHGNLAKFQQQFIDELKEAVAKKPEEGTQEYHNLQLLAEYATAYALEYKPEAVKEIVKIFDQGVKRTISGKVMDGDFHRPYEPILDAVFNIVFENTRYSTMNAEQTKKVLNLLRDFSDREQYSLPTQVFALEVASLLYRPFNKETLRQVGQQRPGFYPVNFNQPDENLRALFAKRIVDIYCPLTAYHYKSYGLSSQEMQALADELAYMYDGLYDISTPTIHMPGQDPHRYPAQCKMVMKNEPNRVKKNKEEQIQIFNFTAGTIFWMYGGELFAYVGTAYRLTRGAVAAMPKAYKAFKGTRAFTAAKMGRFNTALQRGRTGLKLAGQEIRDGAKFSNFIGKSKNQGYIVEFATRPAPSNTAVRTATSAEAPVTYQRVSGWRSLQGKPSRWNPRNWFGGAPKQEVVGVRVTRREPGFKITQGEMHFDTPIDGLHSLQDISRMARELRDVKDGSRLFFEQQPYWTGILDKNQAQMEQLWLDGIKRSFNNQIDMYIPLDQVAKETGKISETTRWWNVRWGAPDEVSPQKWGELVEGKLWGKVSDVGEIVSPNMPIYIAPRDGFRWIRRGAKDVIVGESDLFTATGVTNIADKLPGFFTSGAKLAKEDIYKQIFDAYLKPLNWKGTVAKTFLPDYIPTATFWKSIKVNPVLGAQFIEQLLWRNRFTTTALLFAGFIGVDRVIYPFYKGWLDKETMQEVQQEIAKYGETFSPQRVKEDDLLYQSLSSGQSDPRARRASQNVQGAQPEQKDGTLIVAPIVVARRVLGKTELGKILGVEWPFMNDALKAGYAHKATQANLNHANLVQVANQMKQQDPEAFKEETRAQLEQAEQQMITSFEQGLAVQPQLKEEIHRIFQEYTQDYLNAETGEARMKADEWFTQQIEPVIAQAAQLTQAQSIVQASEQYIQNKIGMAKIVYSDLVTPEVENQLRGVFNEYIRACQAALKSANPFKWLDSALEKEVEKEQKIYEQLSNQGYGPNFDPDAAEE